MLRIVIPALALALLAAPAHADAVIVEKVIFAPGQVSKAMPGRVKGYASVEYIVRAQKGQVLTVSLKTSNASNYFNIWAPDGGDAALAANTTRFAGSAPTAGDYRVQVYLMRNAARRGEAAAYTLTVGVK